MGKKRITIVVSLIAIWACSLWYSALKNDSKELAWIYNWFLDILSSIDDEIRDNSVRCGAFQVAWNDFLDGIEVDNQSQVFAWLSKQNFKSNQISQAKNYYNNFGLFSLDLKSEIEKWVKAKFNENISLKFLSDWSIVPQSSDYYEWKKEKKYGIYSKFKKLINLKNSFEKLEDWTFAGVYDDIKYFGINCNSDKKYDNVNVLYYNSEEDFAVSIKTWWWDDIILSRWTKWKTFMIIYNIVMAKERNYLSEHKFTKNDCLKIPEININFEKELYTLKDQKFSDTDGQIYRVDTAIQDVAIGLDKSSWNKKDKKLVESIELSNIIWDKYRYFYFENPFTIFIKESDKELPYFAAQVSDIKLFQ